MDGGRVVQAVGCQQVSDEIVIGGLRDEGTSQLARSGRAVGQDDLAIDVGRLPPPAAIEKKLVFLADTFDQHFELLADAAALPGPADAALCRHQPPGAGAGGAGRNQIFHRSGRRSLLV